MVGMNAVLLTFALARAEDSSTARVNALEEDFARLEQQLASIKQQHATEMARIKQQHAADMGSIKQEIANLGAKQLRTSASVVSASGSTAATSEEAHGRSRRLSHGSSHYAAVPAMQLHEFPDGGSCTPGSHTRLLAKARDTSAVSWTVSTSDAASDLSLVSVGNKWATTEIQAVPAPIKVVHNADCSATPTLELALDTNVPGQLTVGGVNVLRDSGPFIDPTAWDIDTSKGGINTYYTDHGLIYVQRNSDANDYYLVAATKKPVSYVHLFRATSGTNYHIILALSQSPTGADVEYHIWMSAQAESVTNGVRSTCLNLGEIWHGSDANNGAGTTQPADDNLLTDSDSNDLHIMKIEGTTISFYNNKHNGAATPYRTCTIGAGPWYAKLFLYASGMWQILPAIKHA